MFDYWFHMKSVLIQRYKARIAKAEQADGKGGNAAKKNTVNGTGTPVHISTLQVRMKLSSEIISPSMALCSVRRETLFCGYRCLIELVFTHFSLTDVKANITFGKDIENT